MKKILQSLLAVIMIVGVLLGVGYAGYRIGYNNGSTDSGNTPAFDRFYHMNPNQMPMHNFGEGFDRSFGRGFGFNQHPMMRPGGFNGMGYGYYSPFLLLWRIATIGLIIWFAYWLFTKSGWQISRKKTNSDEPAGN